MSGSSIDTHDGLATVQRPRGRSRFGVWFAAGIVTFVVLAAAVMSVAIAMRLAVAGDVEDYIAAVEASNLDDAVKSELCTDLRRIRQQARAGRRVGLRRWRDHDAALRAIIQDHDITSEELARFRDELQRIDLALAAAQKKR